MITATIKRVKMTRRAKEPLLSICIVYQHKRNITGRQISWCPHHDSNVELLLRTELFYPLNYGGEEGKGTFVFT